MTRALAAAAALLLGAGPLVAAQSGGAQTPAGTALFAGQVVESPSGRPVADAAVTLSGGAPFAVLTDARGRFVFTGVRAGMLFVTVSKPGYAPVLPLLRGIAIKAGEQITDLKLRVVRLASVTGAVRDDIGDPVVGVEVIVFRRAMVNGRPQIRRAGQAFTDDRGMYRVFNLPPGDVLVCACARSPIPFDGVLLKTLASQPTQLLGVAARAVRLGADAVALDDTLRTYPPTFHPSSPTAAGAARVTLAPGDDRTAVDITILPVRALRVSGTITGAPGPLHASSIRLIPAGESEEAASLAPLVPALVQPGGRFDFTGVPPGQYTLRVTYSETKGGGGGPSGAALAFLGGRGQAMSGLGASVPGAQQFWAAEPVAVGADDVVGLSVALKDGPSIAGRMAFVGSAPPPDPKIVSARALVRLELTEFNPTFTGWVPMGRVGLDGTFTISSLPGRHLVFANGVPGWMTLQSITIGGVDVTDMPLELGTRDITDAVVTFTDTPNGSIAGTVSGTRALADDPVVLIFPTDRRYWTDPDAARRRFRTVPVRRDGSFPAAALPAGEYFIAAVPEDAVLDWQDSNRLVVLARSAQRATLADAEKKSIEIRR